MEIGELITVYRRKAGLTIDELVERSGVPKGTLTKIITGVTRAPTLENIKSIAYALGKTLKDFDEKAIDEELFSEAELDHIKKYRALDPYGQDTVLAVLDSELKRCKETKSVEKNNIIPLQLSLQPASAGTGAYLGPEEMETIFVLDTPLTRQAAFGVPVQGDSMEPGYHDGDVLLIERAEDIDIGEVGVFTVDGDGYVKERGDGVLISLNPAYAPIPMSESIRCNGRVIGVLKPEWIVG